MVNSSKITALINAFDGRFIKKSSIADNLTTSDSSKVLSAKQGKELADLIGDAITYINK